MSEPLVSQRQSVAEVVRTILRTQGVRGFYAGMTPVLLRAFPVNAVAYSVYEGIMRLLQAEKVWLQLVPCIARVTAFALTPIVSQTRQ